ncbi:MAG TPA: YfhO family protein [Thermoanaerobaculia bacterium]|nr:YfhO family protein [Thermoanaerobaculia bacterium]
MRRSAATLPLLPLLLALAWLAVLLAPLLVPGRALANRDVPVFHLPLRLTFAQLAGGAGALPSWNPFLHGGQPILSNPNYAAFYPLSWVALPVPAPYGLTLLVVLHAGIAFAGGWFLARRLGCGTGAAALAGVGYAGSGAFLSLLSSFNFFCGMAWFPWVAAWGSEALATGEESRRWRSALLAGGALALQLLAGEPAAAVISGLALLALAAAPLLARGSGAPARRGTALRLAAVLLVALLLAAAQLLPTLRRLPDSPRSGGLDARAGTSWSAPPARLAEVAFPRFFGDPARNQEGLFFGWKLHDGDYPYVPSLYPGLLLVVAGLAGLLRGPVPRRSAWVLAVIAGAFLALGRHNPLYEAMREAVPMLAVLRFPEKFAVLSSAALGFAGILGWQRLLDERGDRRERADLPLALAALFLLMALALTGLLYLRPDAARGFIAEHGPPGLTPAAREAGLAFLRREGWTAVGMAAAVTGLLALCRSRRPSRRTLEVLAVGLLAADLWHYGHGLVDTVPVEIYREPPPLARLPRPHGGRLFVEPPRGDEPRAVLRGGDPRSAVTRAALARLTPYAGLLWQIPYALHEDYDLMLTGWARRALTTLHEEWEEPERAFRYMGVWNVGTALLHKEPGAWAAELARDPTAPPMQAVPNPFLLPRFRFVPRASFHPTWEAALQEARAQGWLVHRHEHAVRPGAPTAPVTYAGRPQTVEFTDERQRMRMRYTSEAPALFTAAVTFDGGWRAAVDGAAVPVWPTAAGQMSVEVPAGEHEIVLEYHQPLLLRGVAISLTALAALAAALLRLRRQAT